VLAGGGRRRTKNRTAFKQINQKVLRLGIYVILIYTATFLAFPGLVVTLESRFEVLGNGWFGVMLITEFTAMDTVGRYFAGYSKGGLTKETLWLPILLRFCLYPVFLLYHIKYIREEFVVVGANALLAVTNGYLVTVCMMLAPGQLMIHEKEVGGAMMSFYAQLGILLGCAGALGIFTVLNRFGY